MSNKILVIKKGYTLKVVSWENDGDNYKTIYQTYQDKTYAKNIKKLCLELFLSKNNSEYGIGNTTPDDNSYQETILSYLEENPDIIAGETNDEKIDNVMDINYDLLGDSEYYISRVCDSAIITYSPEDLYLEII